MKLSNKSREYANKIIKHIESLGGKLQKECPGGSIYLSMNGIRQVRISDHIALKGDIDRIDIIIQKEKEKYKFICIYFRNIKIFDNIDRVKQWIEDLEFTINIVIMNMSTNSIVDKRSYEKQIDSLKREITLKEQSAIRHKKEINKLNNNISKHENAIKKYKEHIRKLSEYHNMWQESQSQANKLNKKLEKILQQNHELKEQLGIESSI